MRSSKSRSRGKSNRSRSPSNNINRVFDSSGPEGKVRGTPQQIIDKYSQLARDASLSNDRVAAENFQQHAEHYTRMLAEAQRDADAKRQQADQQNRERQQRDQERREEKAQRKSDDQQPVVSESSEADVIEADGDEDSGLVETPESAPKPKPRSRAPRKKPEPKDKAEPATPDAPEAAE